MGKWEDFTTKGSPIRRRIQLDGSRLVFEASQPSLPAVLKQNVEKQNATRRTTSLQDGEKWTHVASIPLEIVEAWMAEGINLHDQNDWPKIAQRLNDGSWSKLRTDNPGKVIT